MQSCKKNRFGFTIFTELSDDGKLEGEYFGLWDDKEKLVSYGVSYTEVV